MSMSLAKLDEILGAIDRLKHEVKNSLVAKHAEGTAVSNVTQTLAVTDIPGITSASLQYTDTTIVLTVTPA